MKGLIKFACFLGICFAIYWYGFREGCGTEGALACPDPALEAGVGVTLKHDEVCPKSGYLCYEHKKKFQVARWALDKGALRVRVRPPPFASGQVAKDLQAAAVEGIKVWEGHPFPLIIDDSEFSLRLGDISVSWTKGLFNAAAGLNRQQWNIKGKRLDFSVDGLTIVVPPFAVIDEALLARVRAVATHEMGHALGLRHSDAQKDIMYYRMGPDAAKVEASKRDFKTLDALYALPNGAMVQ